MSNLIGPALVHIRAAERDGVAARTMPAVRRLSISWDPPGAPRRALCWCQGQKRNSQTVSQSLPHSYQRSTWSLHTLIFYTSVRWNLSHL